MSACFITVFCYYSSYSFFIYTDSNSGCIDWIYLKLYFIVKIIYTLWNWKIRIRWLRIYYRKPDCFRIYPFIPVIDCNMGTVISYSQITCPDIMSICSVASRSYYSSYAFFIYTDSNSSCINRSYEKFYFFFKLIFIFWNRKIFVGWIYICNWIIIRSTITIFNFSAFINCMIIPNFIVCRASPIRIIHVIVISIFP